jgi:putative transposase
LIKTYTLAHQLDLTDLFTQYKRVLNQHIQLIWNQIIWTSKTIKKKQSVLWKHLPYRQSRIWPTLPNKNILDKIASREYLQTWTYSTHWMYSAMKTAWSIIHSWYENYKNGQRKRHMPIVTRDFMRIKQTLFQWDGNNSLRLSIYPNQFMYLDLSRRYFKLGAKLGEPIITPTKIHLPFHYPDPPRKETKIAWDSNFHSLDGFSPETGWVKVDLKPLHTIHDIYHDKYRTINQVYARNKHKGKILYTKYHQRERNRVSNYLHRVAKHVALLSDVHGFEALNKWHMTKKSRNFNRKLSDTDWRKFIKYVALYQFTTTIEPYYTSKTCSRCGYLHKDLTSEHIFHCSQCGLSIDRQLNAAINLYQRMNGVIHDSAWFDRTVQNFGGMPAIGAETRVPDELAREPEELMMPKQNLYEALKMRHLNNPSRGFVYSNNNYAGC